MRECKAQCEGIQNRHFQVGVLSPAFVHLPDNTTNPVPCNAHTHFDGGQVSCSLVVRELLTRRLFVARLQQHLRQTGRGIQKNSKSEMLIHFNITSVYAADAELEIYSKH